MRRYFKSGIYCIHNTVNGKRYIGQSVDVIGRIGKHRWALRHNKHKNCHLQGAYNQHTMYMIFSVLERLPISKLDAKETQLIRHYNTTNPKYGYNNETGGNRNKRPSWESRQKMSRAHLGRKLSAETCSRMSRSLRNPSKETRLRMSRAHLGHKLSAEVIRKIISAKTGMKYKMKYKKED
jgi:group I intron endonuclease